MRDSTHGWISLLEWIWVSGKIRSVVFGGSTPSS